MAMILGRSLDAALSTIMSVFGWIVSLLRDEAMTLTIAVFPEATLTLWVDRSTGCGHPLFGIVPEIAEKVRKLHVFQRTAAWSPPKSLFDYSDWIKVRLL